MQRRIFIPEVEKEICTKYAESKIGSTYLAREYGCSVDTILCVIRRNGFTVKRRNYKGKNNPFYSKTHSKKQRREWSASRKGKLPASYRKKWTLEQRAKLSITMKGRKINPEWRKKISRSLKGRTPWNKGISPSAETRAKLSRAMNGRKMSLEWRKKISEACKGRPPLYPAKKFDDGIGNRLRTELELEIAKRLQKFSISYIYEQILNIPKLDRNFFPDFTVVSNGKVIARIEFSGAHYEFWLKQALERARLIRQYTDEPYHLVMPDEVAETVNDNDLKIIPLSKVNTLLAELKRKL